MNQIDKWMHDIVDEIHPSFTAISDEEMIEETADYGYFTRTFLHENGKNFRMKWRVYFGTPETVKTVFEPVQILN